MNKWKIIAGIIVFGSFWGFSEILIGSALSDMGLPTGTIMTGFFALTILVLSRMYFKQPGMQLGIGLVAGGLRLFNPFMGCHLCSALAIMAEGAIFELIWYKISPDFKQLKNTINQVSIGIITTYTIFIGGYIITQILTPIVAGSTFYIENLLVFMPSILARGLIPAILGGAILPVAFLIKKADIKIKDHLYYPATLSISVVCWLIIFGIWAIFS